MTGFPAENSLRDFLRALASAEETHGAVSAAAVAGSIGASLLLKVAALPKTRSDSMDDRAKLMEAATALNEVQEQFIETVETETALKIFAARNMPQANDKQRTERQDALQLALRAASDVPLEVIRLCALGLQHAETIAACCARAASFDVQLGIALLDAAFNGSRANLEARLSSLTDVRYITFAVDEIARLSVTATTAIHAAESFLRIPPA